MKNYLLLLFFLSFLSGAYAQIEFAPPGATWYHSFLDVDWRGVVYLDGYQKTQYKRDTLIDNKNCKILGITQTGSIDGEIVTYQRPDRIIYQEGYELFSYKNNSFYKLYDFSLEKGDTLDIEPNQEGCIITVDSVYFENINGEDIKHLLVSSDFGGQWLMNEKMGMLTYGLFTPEWHCYFDVRFVGELRCYEDDNFPLYQKGSIACDSYDNVSNIVDLSALQIKIHPNPIGNNLQIKNESSERFTLLIYNANGQLVYQSIDEEDFDKNVDCTEWLSGIYIAKVRIGESWAFKKLVKLD